jgi:hypothetical protein
MENGISNISALTTVETWDRYWSTKGPIRIGKDHRFSDVIDRLTDQTFGTSIEIGGFPGYFSVYLKKYCDFAPTLIDFYFNETFFSNLLIKNGLAQGDVAIIKDDVFSYCPSQQYNFVCSFGFLEHFINIDTVLKSHVKFACKGAKLMIAIPNFKGINGIIQRIFDKKNYNIHNTQIMNIAKLRKAAFKAGLSKIQVFYYPSTYVWLEDINRRSIGIRASLWFVGMMVRILGEVFGKRSRILSDSIVLTAEYDSSNTNI